MPNMFIRLAVVYLLGHFSFSTRQNVVDTAVSDTNMRRQLFSEFSIFGYIRSRKVVNYFSSIEVVCWARRADTRS